jgi:hypothetical protein
VDFTRAVLDGRWHDRPVWIAGALSASDTTSPQIWVDVETQAVVRAIFPPVPGTPAMDMHFEKLVRLGGGWLATRCEFYRDGKLVQLEEYDSPREDPMVAAGLFDAGTWSTAPHWAHKTK